MYEQLVNKYRSAFPEFPREPNLDLGLGIKQIRLRMGMTQSELARDAGMKPTALKSLENGYAKFTTTKNLEALAQALLEYETLNGDEIPLVLKGGKIHRDSGGDTDSTSHKKKARSGSVPAAGGVDLGSPEPRRV